MTTFKKGDRVIMYVTVDGIDNEGDRIRLDEMSIDYTGVRYFHPIPKQPHPRAEQGGKYWFIHQDLTVSYAPDGYKEYDNRMYDSGNYFLSEKDALAALEKVKRVFEEAN